MATKGSTKEIHNEDQKVTTTEDDIEKLYTKLQSEGDKRMLLKQCLTPDMFEKLKNKKTKHGGTLKDCIKSGCLYPACYCGMFACDADAYVTFDELFRAVIKNYHGVDKHPTPDFGLDKIMDTVLPEKDEDGETLVSSTRIRVGRSLEDKEFCPTISLKERRDIETKVVKVLGDMTGEHKGKYYALNDMTLEEKKRLVDDHYLFKDNDPALRAAGGHRDWDDGRGIYYNDDKTFLVWINEEDHLRFISMQMKKKEDGDKTNEVGDIKRVYKRLVDAMQKIEESDLKFAISDDYGYLTSCPTNVGTTMRASVHVDLRELRRANKVQDMCNQFHLQARGPGGEITKAGTSDVHDISNKRRLGLTEHEILNSMILGINEMIKEEVKLRKLNKGAKK